MKKNIQFYLKVCQDILQFNVFIRSLGIQFTKKMGFKPGLKLALQVSFKDVAKSEVKL